MVDISNEHEDRSAPRVCNVRGPPAIVEQNGRHLRHDLAPQHRRTGSKQPKDR